MAVEFIKKKEEIIFPDYELNILKEGDEKIYSLRTNVRIKRDGKYVLVKLIETYSCIMCDNFDSLYRRFISEAYDIIFLHSGACSQVDKSQISEKQRLQELIIKT